MDEMCRNLNNNGINRPFRTNGWDAEKNTEHRHKIDALARFDKIFLDVTRYDKVSDVVQFWV